MKILVAFALAALPIFCQNNIAGTGSNLSRRSISVVASLAPADMNISGLVLAQEWIIVPLVTNTSRMIYRINGRIADPVGVSIARKLVMLHQKNAGIGIAPLVFPAKPQSSSLGESVQCVWGGGFRQRSGKVNSGNAQYSSLKVDNPENLTGALVYTAMGNRSVLRGMVLGADGQIVDRSGQSVTIQIVGTAKMITLEGIRMFIETINEAEFIRNHCIFAFPITIQ